MVDSHYGAVCLPAKTAIITTDRRTDMLSFGETLARARKAKHLTQKDVSSLLKERYGMDVKSGSISHWEKEEAVPNARQFLLLCELYQVQNINETFGVFDQANPLSRLNSEGMEKVYEYAALLLQSELYQKQAAQIIPFSRQIPRFYIAASAGTGQYLDSDAYEMIDVGSEVSSLADFGITLAGDSMEPLYVNGQTVWVHRQEALSCGEIGIFYYDGNAYCKKYMDNEDGIQLISLNKKYDPIEIDESKGFKIFGKVVG